MLSNLNTGMFSDNRESLSKNKQRIDPGVFEYFGYMREFTRLDWIKYIAWIGMMASLGVATISFLLLGLFNGAVYPSYVWLIPIGIFGFTIAISIDNIAHSVIYKEWISQSELTIHKFTTTSGIASTVALILGYAFPDFFFIPILVFIALSVMYSLIDEVIHWIRYSRGGSGIVEVSMHFMILVFHPLMVFAWLLWYLDGYPGVSETFSALGIPI